MLLKLWVIRVRLPRLAYILELVLMEEEKSKHCPLNGDYCDKVSLDSFVMAILLRTHFKTAH